MRKSKSAIQSKTLLGVVIAAIPMLDGVYSQLTALPIGFLPPHIASIVSGLGLALAFIGRLTANKNISGVLSTLDK